jgi:transposase-like protein
LGSGGYVFAKLTEQEELRASLGIPQIFLSNVERLNEDRFSRYFCKKCGKKYLGSLLITYGSPSENIGEDVMLPKKENINAECAII